MISLEGKTNFSKKRVAEYQKSGVIANLEGNHGGGDSTGAGNLDFKANF